MYIDDGALFLGTYYPFRGRFMPLIAAFCRKGFVYTAVEVSGAAIIFAVYARL